MTPSTIPSLQPKANSTVTAITTQTLTYAPAVYAGVMAVDEEAISGQDKFDAVLNGVIGTSSVLATTPNPQVAGIAALINLFASLVKAVKAAKAPKTATAAAVAHGNVAVAVALPVK